MNHTWDKWGDLAPRYKEEKPRRMLALDGGGIRGLITLQVLEKLEDDLRKKYGGGEDFRLCHFFDYMGGTSTGAIIAAALALGLSVKEVQIFYEAFGKEAFSKNKWRYLIKSLYAQGKLQKKLAATYGSKTDLLPFMPGEVYDADRKHLKTLLLVITKNVSTDSAWPVSSNPFAKYNEPARRDCNLRIPLWQLVRASTAAPVYFPPEVIKWDSNDDRKEFVFVDGGTTSYNCPAFIMARMATEPKYNLGWKKGEQNLLIVSIGAGYTPVKGPDGPDSNIAIAALHTFQGLMSQAMFDQDINCRTVGRCSFGHELDREVGDLVPNEPIEKDLGKAFLYARYNAKLTKKGLKALGLDGIDPDAVSALDSVDNMNDLKRIGKALAQQFSLSHLGGFVDVELYR